MKSILVILGIFAVTSIGQSADESAFTCPQPYLSELKPIALKNYYGIWYVIRTSTKDGQEHADVACSSQYLWRTTDTAENTVNSVDAHRINGAYQVQQGMATVKPVGADGQIDNHWKFQIKNVTLTAVFVYSDDGQNYGIGHRCIVEEGKPTSFWAVLSRTKTMDAKLEQELVEKIQKWSGLSQEKFRGVQQNDCYKVEEKTKA